MFPLGTPLVPGSLLPLQIFEPRYQQMISDVLESSEPEFGVVLIERGHEVGGGDIRSMAGTVAVPVAPPEALNLVQMARQNR